MNNLNHQETFVIRWRDQGIDLLDQTQLPGKEIYLRITDLETMAEAIESLRIRGAPAIGVAGGYGVVLGMMDFSKEKKPDFEEVFKRLKSTRPTAVNLFWALERMKKVYESQNGSSNQEIFSVLLEEAKQIEREDKESCNQIGLFGAALLPKKATVLTHCNAGALATAGIGTALAVIYKAVEQGKQVSVFADETRPLWQGARLTAWELKKHNIPVTVLVDGAAAHTLRCKNIDCVIVGADRIASNGDVANKIGTYAVALGARAAKVPFYVAAPLSTIDLSLSSGEEIPIEERKKAEITNPRGGEAITPEGVKTFSPAFDVTPAELISGIITDAGIAKPPYPASLAELFHVPQ